MGSSIVFFPCVKAAQMTACFRAASGCDNAAGMETPMATFL